MNFGGEVGSKQCARSNVKVCSTVTPCSLVDVYQHFVGTSRLRVQARGSIVSVSFSLSVYLDGWMDG